MNYIEGNGKMVHNMALEANSIHLGMEKLFSILGNLKMGKWMVKATAE